MSLLPLETIGQGSPNPQLVSVNWPSSPQAPGTQVNFSFTVRNDGDYGVIQMYLTNGGEEVLWEHPLEMNAGQVRTEWVGFIMPPYSVQLYFEVGYDDVDGVTVTDFKSGPTISIDGNGPVLQPNPKIVSVNWPSSPQAPGTQVDFPMVVRNDGDAGIIQLWLTNGGEEILWEVPLAMGGEAVEVWATFTMPAYAVQLYLEVGYEATVTDYLSGPVIDSGTAMDIATTLTFNISPSKVQVGGGVQFNGKLSAEGGVGIQQIFLMINGIDLLSVYTDETGLYNGTFIAPLIEGTYDLNAVFMGSGNLLPSFSSTMSLMTSEEQPSTGLPLALIAIAVVGVLLLDRRRT